MAALVTIVRVDGNVFLMDPRKPVVQGMAIPEGASLFAPDGGRLVLADGTILPLNAGQPVTLQIIEGVATVIAADPASADPDVASLQAAIASGQDPTAIQEAPAAGAGADGGGNLSEGGGFSAPFDIARIGREESSTYRYAASASDLGRVTVTPASFSPEASSTAGEGMGPSPVVSVNLDAIAIDDIVNLAESGQSITLSGKGGGDAVAGDQVTVTIGGVAYSTVLGEDLGFSVVVPGGLLAQFPSATATLTHVGEGSVVTATSTRPYSVDVDAPAPTVQLNTIAGDDVVNAAESGQPVTLTGLAGGDAVAGDIVTVAIGGQQYQAAVADDLTFSVVVPGSLLASVAGSTVTAVISHTDAAGNTGTATTTHAYGVDITAPTLGIALDTIAGDNVINAAEANQSIPVSGQVSGEYASGDRVTLTVGNQTYTGSVKADGTFSINVPGSQLASNSSVSAVVSHTDAAGNTGSANTAGSYDVDTVAPSVSISLDTVAGDDVINAAEAKSNVSVSGTAGGDAAQGDTVTVSVGGQNYTTTVGANGIFSVAVPGTVLANAGTDSIRASVSHTDAAGNTGTATTTHAYGVDTTAPSVSISLDTVAGDDVINAAESRQNVTLSGTAGGDAAQGDTVTVTVGGQNYTTTVGANGIFSVAVPGTVLANAGTDSIRASVSHTDAAGNTGTATTTHAYGVDTAAPTLGITLDTIAGDNIVNAAEANQSIPVSGQVSGEYASGDRVTLTVGNQTYTGTLKADGTFSINV
ncbi:hypothetical protein BTW08_13660, partial [Salinicola sp. MH3R3-1]|uniref:retention module-containing protein n=1 Tax=Salinicola sp. MH3R3-1 TaxID=1928762 RepID=UPI000961C3F0